jgi:hypothetical protein
MNNGEVQGAHEQLMTLVASTIKSNIHTRIFWRCYKYATNTVQHAEMAEQQPVA